MRLRFHFFLFVSFLWMTVRAGHADILLTLENPGQSQRISGISVVSGWGFSSTSTNPISLSVSIDGVPKGTIPCCGQRPDVAREHPIPQARNSGFGLLFNFNRLAEGTHTLTIEARDDAGSPIQQQEHTITVVKPGGFEFLSALSFANAKDPLLSDDKQEIIINEAAATDNTTDKTQKVNLHVAWQPNTQTLSVVQTENVGDPTGGNADKDGDGFYVPTDCNDDDPNIHPGAQEVCTDNIDNNCDGLIDSADLACGAKDTSPTISLTLENPGSGTTATIGGISLISGWTFTRTPNATIRNVQVRVDGALLSDVPCCSERSDVQEVFPTYPQALQSGFGLLTNFNRLDNETHTIIIEAQDNAGITQTAQTTVAGVKIADSEFLDAFDLSNAKVSFVGDTLELDGVTVRDKATQQVTAITADYVWDASCQCFTVQAGCGNGSIEAGEECDGANLNGASCASSGFGGGTLSCRPRCPVDDKKCTLPCIFDFSACSGAPSLYVTNSGSNSVSVIDSLTETETTSIKVGKQPRGIAVSPDGSTVYVANFDDDTLSVIDTTTRAVTATVKAGDGPLSVAVAPDGNHVYVVNGFDGTVSVLDAGIRAITATIPVGEEPQTIVLTADGKQGYVTNFADNSVTVLNLTTNTPETTFLVGIGPDGLAITPDRTKLYVVNFGSKDIPGSGSVSVVDRATNRVTNTIQVGLSPTRVVFTPDGKQAFVSNSIDSTISVILTADLSLGSPLVVTSGRSTASQPDGMLITANGRRLYVAEFGDGVGLDVEIFSVVTNAPLKTLKVQSGPFALVEVPAR